MKNHIIAANWKSNMTENEAKKWLEAFLAVEIPEDLDVILFAPFTLLDFVSSFISQNNLRLKLGAQNISQFDEGAYTGEVNAHQIKEFANYVLIGHFERRENFGEDTAVIKKKIENATLVGLIPLVCISDFDQAREFGFAKEAIFAFEPVSAIGSGNPEDSNKVAELSKKFSAAFENQLIYGGSINPDNAKEYLTIPGISGVLVGTESLSPQRFSEIINV
jgi:triosephosphate isomerase